MNKKYIPIDEYMNLTIGTKIYNDEFNDISVITFIEERNPSPYDRLTLEIIELNNLDWEFDIGFTYPISRYELNSCNHYLVIDEFTSFQPGMVVYMHRKDDT